MKIKPIYIKSMSAACAAGDDFNSISKTIKSENHALTLDENLGCWVGKFPKSVSEKLNAFALRNELNHLDPTVINAIYCAQIAVGKSGWNNKKRTGVCLSSSRGATQIWEKHHAAFSVQGKSGLSPLTSPLTTLGNISSNVASFLGIGELNMSHSMTCSSSLHSLINGVAWMRAEFVDRCVVGGSESPLSPFTIGQFEALRLYSRGGDWPCAPFANERRSGVVLGEGAAVFCLDTEPEGALARIDGVGFAMEEQKHSVYISADGDALGRAMEMAKNEKPVDGLLAHAPGTKKGDRAELRAIERVLGNEVPVVSNKWIIGHTLGAAGALNMYMAILSIQKNVSPSMPFLSAAKGINSPQSVLVNTIGFGGNAASILLSKV